MNIVIPFDGEGEEELRFALRSIDMNFQHDNVYLVSVKVPDWIKNVIIVPQEDIHKHNKDANLFDKVFAAIDFGLQGDFMFWSDDQICLKKHDPIVVYNRRNPFLIRPQSKWQVRLIETAFMIKKMTGVQIDRNFDSHVPQPMNTDRFNRLRNIDYQSGNGLCICTLYYGLNYPNKMVEQESVKQTYELSRETKVEDANKIWLGFDVGSFHRIVKPFLYKKFTKKSKFEK